MARGSGIGASPKRKEDPALVIGAGRFLDDIRLPLLLHLGVVRSPHAHARISRVSASEALGLPGVVAAFGAADLPEVASGVPPSLPFDHLRPSVRPVVAREKVRYVGEPVALVVADDPYRLHDAMAAVSVEYEPLPPVVTV